MMGTSPEIHRSRSLSNAPRKPITPHKRSLSVKHGLTSKPKDTKVSDATIASDTTNTCKRPLSTPDKPKKHKSKKSTINNTVTRKSNPLKNTQATDSNNCNLGSIRGG